MLCTYNLAVDGDVRQIVVVGVLGAEDEPRPRSAGVPPKIELRLEIAVVPSLIEGEVIVDVGAAPVNVGALPLQPLLTGRRHQIAVLEPRPAHELPSIAVSHIQRMPPIICVVLTVGHDPLLSLKCVPAINLGRPISPPGSVL